MESWSGARRPAPARRRPAAGAVRLGAAGRASEPPRWAGRTMYVCGITPYDATHLGHAATMITFDLVNRVWRDAGLDVRYVQNVTDIDDPLLERAARDGEDWVVLGDARDRPVPRGHGGAADHPAGALRRRGRVDPGDRRPGRRAARRRRRVPARGRHRRRLLRRRRRAPVRLRVQPVDRERDAASSSAERGGDPERAGKRDPLDPLLWRGARDGEPAWDGGDARPRPPRLAHRVRRDRAGPARRHRSTCRAAATT